MIAIIQHYFPVGFGLREKLDRAVVVPHEVAEWVARQFSFLRSKNEDIYWFVHVNGIVTRI